MYPSDEGPWRLISNQKMTKRAHAMDEQKWSVDTVYCFKWDHRVKNPIKKRGQIRKFKCKITYFLAVSNFNQQSPLNRSYEVIQLWWLARSLSLDNFESLWWKLPINRQVDSFPKLTRRWLNDEVRGFRLNWFSSFQCLSRWLVALLRLTTFAALTRKFKTRGVPHAILGTWLE